MTKISFNLDKSIPSKVFKIQKKSSLSSWLVQTIEQEGYKLNELNYIFCSNDKILEINKDYLNHNYYTDIITFDLSDKPSELLADIYISIETVLENSLAYNTTFEQEMTRVLIHGVLHLIGYDDKTKSKKTKMTAAENYALTTLTNLNTEFFVYNVSRETL